MTIVQSAAAAEVRAARPGFWTSLLVQRRLQLASLILVDVFAATGGFWLAYMFRYVNQVGGDIPGESFVPIDTYVPFWAVFVGTSLLLNHLRGTYSLPR